jgi:hypothetical protein
LCRTFNLEATAPIGKIDMACRNIFLFIHKGRSGMHLGGNSFRKKCGVFKKLCGTCPCGNRRG